MQAEEGGAGRVSGSDKGLYEYSRNIWFQLSSDRRLYDSMRIYGFSTQAIESWRQTG